MLGTAAARLRWPLDDAPQQPTPGDTYVAGGYTESAIRGRAEELVTRPTTIRFADEQLRYLTRIVRFSTERGAKVVVVINPIGSRTTRAITNYWQVSGRLADLARASGALFWDFNGEVPLDDDDFKDADHLNASGVGKFNRAFVERLKLHGLAAPRDRASGR
jgi:lysophospholipase L1-like esterase